MRLKVLLSKGVQFVEVSSTKVIVFLSLTSSQGWVMVFRTALNWRIRNDDRWHLTGVLTKGAAISYLLCCCKLLHLMLERNLRARNMIPISGKQGFVALMPT